ncbi:MAG TPA: AEC family transporter [Solirubrobacteraceae bacterium]|nr:AEC family transporter [Solirubrobacteraceae bacterium]
MLLVILAVVAATGLGVVAEHRADSAQTAARWILTLMLYVLVPFVAFVSFVHLHLSLGGGVGLGVAYLGIGIAGLLAWWAGHRLNLEGPALGGLICTVILVNTGYLGVPMAVVVFGSHALSKAVAYDQVVSGPMVYTVGFGIGAAFGTRGSGGRGERLRAFLTRNPPLLAVVAGLLAPAAAAPPVLVHAAHVVVDVMLVIGFFAVGVYLSSERRDDAAPLLERPDRPVTVALGLRFLINPVLLALVSAVGVAIPSVYLLQAAMPTGINSLIVGHAFGLDQRLIATIIVWSTIVVLAGGLIFYLA